MPRKDFGELLSHNPVELKTPMENLINDPIYFLGAQLTKCEREWSTFEKEGSAIFHVFSRLDYMLQRNSEINVFTDHINLLFVFAPSVLLPKVGQHEIAKVQ